MNLGFVNTKEQLQGTINTLQQNNVDGSMDLYVGALQGYVSSLDQVTNTMGAYTQAFTNDSSFLMMGIGAFVVVMVLRYKSINDRFYRYG